MKIAMFTNTYLPHIGGVARSLKTLEDECRKLGHEVKIIAPELESAEESKDVLRVPAIQNFNGSDFAFRLPAPTLVREFIDDFNPDIIHSHHPFLLGDTALRQAWRLEIPIVFTHHTLYENYTHYVPMDSTAIKRIAIQLATEYCNLCDQVIAPSESISRLLRDRGVSVPIEVIPTGVDTAAFQAGDGARFRKKEGISDRVLVIGHVGRLAHEKNLQFLAEAVAINLNQNGEAIFLLIGEGEERAVMLEILQEHVATGRVHVTGKLTSSNLADAYAAMDLFVFCSQSETQGMVLAEAMAVGKPVVALDGPGVREIVVDGENGILLNGDATVREFANAIMKVASDKKYRVQLGNAARISAAEFDHHLCAPIVTQSYERLIENRPVRTENEKMPWDRFLNSVETEWDLFSAKMVAASAAVIDLPGTEAILD